MGVRKGREFVDGHPLRQRRTGLVDQLTADRPDARTAEDFTRRRIGQELHVTVPSFRDERFTMARESNTPEPSRYHGIVHFRVLSQHLGAVLG